MEGKEETKINYSDNTVHNGDFENGNMRCDIGEEAVSTDSDEYLSDPLR